MATRFEKFSERARRALSLAQEEASRHGHNYIGTEHLLLGLLRQPNSHARRTLEAVGADLDRLRSGVETIIGRSETPYMGDTGLTPRMKKVIEFAVNEVREMGVHYVGTAHLLLGLLHEGVGVAAGVLESQRLTVDRMRQETKLILAREGTGPEVEAGGEIDPPGPMRTPSRRGSASSHWMGLGRPGEVVVMRGGHTLTVGWPLLLIAGGVGGVIGGTVALVAAALMGLL